MGQQISNGTILLPRGYLAIPGEVELYNRGHPIVCKAVLHTCELTHVHTYMYTHTSVVLSFRAHGLGNGIQPHRDFLGRTIGKTKLLLLELNPNIPRRACICWGLLTF